MARGVRYQIAGWTPNGVMASLKATLNDQHAGENLEIRFAGFRVARQASIRIAGGER